MCRAGSQQVLSIGSETYHAFYITSQVQKTTAIGMGRPLRQDFFTGFVKISRVTLIMVGGIEPPNPLGSYAPWFRGLKQMTKNKY